jgi:ribosome recycling factor
MKKTIDSLKGELSYVRTGRASTSTINAIKVDSYGSIVPLNQIASVSIPNAKTIEIKPWDLSQLNAIEKAIFKADIGMISVNDGQVIRISVPSLTEEKRREIAKSINRMAEDFKIAIRNERRFLVDNIKKFEKDKIISEDDKKIFEAKAQKITDYYISKIDDAISAKEKDILQI